MDSHLDHFVDNPNNRSNNDNLTVLGLMAVMVYDYSYTSLSLEIGNVHPYTLPCR